MQTKLPIGQTTGQQIVNNEEKIVVPTTEKKPLWTAQGYQGKEKPKPVEEAKYPTQPVATHQPEGTGIILPPGVKSVFGPNKGKTEEPPKKVEKPNPTSVAKEQKIQQFKGLFEGISKQKESDSDSSEDSEDSEEETKQKKPKLKEPVQPQVQQTSGLSDLDLLMGGPQVPVSFDPLDPSSKVQTQP